jgi:hypothetical protein
MTRLTILTRLAGLTAAAIVASCTTAPPVRVAAATCEKPPEAACPESGCVVANYTAQGNAVDPKTGRKFFLDYPCDLKPGEKVNFVLNIHGGGSFATWQRHYFPAFKYKEKYRLVVATPTAATAAPIRMWTGPADDQHLQNIVDLVVEQFGRDNIKSFWLAGHSQGGMTSNRIVCTDYFKDKVDGWLSLSGGRIGPAQIPPDFFGSGGPPRELDAAGASAGGARPGSAAPPTCDISYIFTSGELEIMGLPEKSPWAEKYQCAARERRADIVDTQKGYVTGAAAGRPASWGREARPGTAQVFVYPKCKSGKVVADVIRLDKGHTEGLEPLVTEELIKMMVAAPGGKLAGKK